jgi:hypothetical protein
MKNHILIFLASAPLIQASSAPEFSWMPFSLNYENSKGNHLMVEGKEPLSLSNIMLNRVNEMMLHGSDS